MRLPEFYQLGVYMSCPDQKIDPFDFFHKSLATSYTSHLYKSRVFYYGNKNSRENTFPYPATEKKDHAVRL